MKVVCLTLILSCLSAASALAGGGEEMKRQRLLFCSHYLIEEGGTVAIPQWTPGSVAAAKRTGDCIKFSE
jgi:hypothetical protein